MIHNDDVFPVSIDLIFWGLVLPGGARGPSSVFAGAVVGGQGDGALPQIDPVLQDLLSAYYWMGYQTARYVFPPSDSATCLDNDGQGTELLKSKRLPKVRCTVKLMNAFYPLDVVMNASAELEIPSRHPLVDCARRIPAHLTPTSFGCIKNCDFLAGICIQERTTTPLAIPLRNLEPCPEHAFKVVIPTSSGPSVFANFT